MGTLDQVPNPVEYLKGRWPARECEPPGPLADVSILLTVLHYLNRSPEHLIESVFMPAAGLAHSHIVATATMLHGTGRVITLKELPAEAAFLSLAPFEIGRVEI